jgi:protocatechuate 3,4-dioxygenase beta subunit
VIRAAFVIVLVALGCSSRSEDLAPSRDAIPEPTRNAPACSDATPTASTITIAPREEPGARLTLSGRVLDAAGEPVSGVRIYAYHTDTSGVYSNDPSGASPPRLCGVLMSDEDGHYSIYTIRPGPYPSGGNPAHVHFELSGAGIDELVTEVFFEGERFLDVNTLRARMPSADISDARTSIVRPLVDDGNGGYLCDRDFVVRRTSNGR